MIKQKIGFIGAGQMAKAVASGITRAGLVEGKQIWASDPFGAARDAFAAEVPGANVTDDNLQVVAEVDVLFLMVKPQLVMKVMDGLADAVTERHLVVSIVGGLRISQMAEKLGDAPRLSRIAPNTACAIGRSASGFCLGPTATEADGVLIGELLSACGIVHKFEEKSLDAIVGLAGSGIAYVYLMIEALSDGGVLEGLPRKLATEMAAQTMLGAAEMVLQTGEHTGTLTDRTTSPGGSTIEGLAAIEEGGVRGALIAAVRASTEKSIKLGKMPEDQ